MATALDAAAAVDPTSSTSSLVSTPNDRKLSDIFEEAYNLYNGFDKLDMPSNTPEFQLEVSKCSTLLENATRLVSAVGLFSDNESADEIATEHLKYLLLPYFLGQLVQKRSGGDRSEYVRVAGVYFKDFLARCEEYGFHSNGAKSLVLAGGAAGSSSSSGDKMAELTQMAHDRNAKLEQYRRKKELNDEIGRIRILMEREHIDDALKREFYVKLVRSSCLEATDELRSLAQEQQMLAMMGGRGGGQRAIGGFEGEGGAVGGSNAEAGGSCSHGHHHHPNHRHGPRPAPLKPVIITKDAFQKAVYGAGYPSLPTYSVDEFYEERVAAGVFPDPTVQRDPNSVQARAMRGEATELDEEQDIQREEDEQNDDEVYLARARNMDEFKDEVRRGDGNRHNRS